MEEPMGSGHDSVTNFVRHLLKTYLRKGPVGDYFGSRKVLCKHLANIDSPSPSVNR